MTLPTSINISTAFDITSFQPKFKLANLTPFIGEGITLTNVKGNFKIVNPAGIEVWNNTSTVTPALYSFAISTITGASGTAPVTSCTPHGLMTGDTVLVSGSNLSDYNGFKVITVLNTTQFTYATITSGSASGTLLGLKCSLNTIAIPTDASTLMPLPGSYVITLTTIVAGIVQNGTYVKSFSYTYDYVRPVVTISQSVNGFIPRYYSTDTTTYMGNAVQPTITRPHNIDFPAASMIPSETFVTQAVEINPPKLWNGIYTTTISSLLSYTMSDNLIILDKVFNAQTFTVSINVDLCRINCCMNNLNDKYQAALSNNTYQSVVYGDQLARATQLI